MTTLIGGIVASIVPSSPSGAIAVVASITLALFVAFFVYLSLAPPISDLLEKRQAAGEEEPAIEHSANEAD